MKYRGYRLDVVFTTLVLTVALLIMGHLAYVRLLVERPLVQELQTIPGVKEVSLARSGERYVLSLDLAKVDDLPQVYRKAEEMIGQSLPPGTYVVKIKDRRSNALENVYRRIHYYVEEALVRGNFSTAAERIAAEAGSSGVDQRFFVDENRVYIELLQGDNYLYEVRQRPVRVGEGAVLPA